MTALPVLYTVFITYFSLHPDGQWLTTGAMDTIDDLDRAGVEKLVADRAAPGLHFGVSAHDGRTGAETMTLGSAVLHWFEDDDVLVERDRRTFATIAAGSSV